MTHGPRTSFKEPVGERNTGPHSEAGPKYILWFTWQLKQEGLLLDYWGDYFVKFFFWGGGGRHEFRWKGLPIRKDERNREENPQGNMNRSHSLVCFVNYEIWFSLTLNSYLAISKSSLQALDLPSQVKDDMYIFICIFTGYKIVYDSKENCKSKEIYFPSSEDAFFVDPTNIGILISDFSAFSKSSLNIWRFTVHVLLKLGLENFDHYFASL